MEKFSKGKDGERCGRRKRWCWKVVARRDVVRVEVRDESGKSEAWSEDRWRREDEFEKISNSFEGMGRAWRKLREERRMRNVINHINNIVGTVWVKL